jgi:hypothetical protein
VSGPLMRHGWPPALILWQVSSDGCVRDCHRSVKGRMPGAFLLSDVTSTTSPPARKSLNAVWAAPLNSIHEISIVAGKVNTRAIAILRTVRAIRHFGITDPKRQKHKNRLLPRNTC